ncbi:MAG: PP2C family protein-serine/threonine phosphatase [Nocardioides sp.]
MEAPHPATRVEIEPRLPAPDRRLDLVWALGVTALASVAYVGALILHLVPGRDWAVVFFGAAPICAAFALVVLHVRGRAERDAAVRWFAAGLAVAWLAMVLQLISFPVLSPGGGPFGTDAQSNAALYLWFHLAPAAAAVAGALNAPRAWRLPSTVAGAAVAVLFAVNAVPLPVLLLPDATFTGLLVGLEYAAVGVLAVAATLWVLRVGRAAPALRGWVGVALSLSLYDVLLNAFAAERFTPVWWASLSLRVATYAVLAIGVVVSMLVRLAETESYGEAEMERRETQLRSSLRVTSQLLSCAEDLARAVTPEQVAAVLCADAVAAGGLPHASLLVSGPGEGLHLLGSFGYDDRMRAEVTDIGWDTPHPGPQTLLRGDPVFLGSADAIRAQFPAVARTPLRGAATLAALPIRFGNEALGALILWDGAPRALERLQRQLLNGLAAEGGLALKRAQAYENEANAAATLQRSLLPSRLPDLPSLSLAARYLPGERGLRVGGDWYDCVKISDRLVALVVGDVMGKGLRAASLMGQLRTSVRSLASADPSPAAVLTGLDRLSSMLDTYEIATLVYVLLDTESGVATVARAGHLPPILIDPEGRATVVEAGSSPPLGSPSGPRLEARVDVRPGSLFVLYTDGIVEERATGLDGLEGFVSMVARAAVAHGDDVEGIVTDVLAGAGSPERADDIAVLVARAAGVDTGASGDAGRASTRTDGKPGLLVR